MCVLLLFRRFAAYRMFYVVWEGLASNACGVPAPEMCVRVGEDGCWVALGTILGRVRGIRGVSCLPCGS